jgi:hypothetical protein
VTQIQVQCDHGQGQSWSRPPALILHRGIILSSGDFRFDVNTTTAIVSPPISDDSPLMKAALLRWFRDWCWHSNGRSSLSRQLEFVVEVNRARVRVHAGFKFGDERPWPRRSSAIRHKGIAQWSGGCNLDLSTAKTSQTLSNRCDSSSRNTALIRRFQSRIKHGDGSPWTYRLTSMRHRETALSWGGLRFDVRVVTAIVPSIINRDWSSRNRAMIKRMQSQSEHSDEPPGPQWATMARHWGKARSWCRFKLDGSM